MNFSKLIVLTNMPSPYQVDLFNALCSELNIEVIYAKMSEPSRKWDYEKHIKHNHVFLSGPLHHRITQLRALLKENAIFIVSGYNLPVFIYAMSYLTSKKAPWVFWGEKIRIKRLWIKNHTIFRLLKHARAILGIGEVAARLYYELLKVPAFVFPYHIDTSRFKKDSYFLSNRINFLYSGQLIKRKGIFDILEAFDIVRKEYGEKVALHIVGDGPLMKDVEQRTRAYSSLVQLYGFVKYEKLPDIYVKGDVFLFPSLYDGWGVALAEGMASKMVPISTFTTGAATDLILHGKNGFIVPPGNPIALSYYMKQLIKNPEKIKDMGEKAAEYVNQYNDVQKGTQKLIQILSEIK